VTDKIVISLGDESGGSSANHENKDKCESHDGRDRESDRRPPTTASGYEHNGHHAARSVCQQDYVSHTYDRFRAFPW
jgi:hypothetical protein